MRSANGLAASTRLRDVDAVLAWLLAVIREPDVDGVTSAPTSASDRARLLAVSDAACSDTRGGERAGSLDAPFCRLTPRGDALEMPVLSPALAPKMPFHWSVLAEELGCWSERQRSRCGLSWLSGSWIWQLGHTTS
jgi:hypothetical protein